MFDSFTSLSSAAKKLHSQLTVISEFDFLDKSLDVRAENGEIKTAEFKLISKNELSEKASRLFPAAPAPLSDAYIIISEGDSLTALSATKAGLYFAAGAIKRYMLTGGIPDGSIYNTPCAPFRGLKLYIPAREDIQSFYEIVELCGFFGFNTVMMEVGGAMEYKLHRK